jgi:hypothetical protein
MKFYWSLKSVPELADLSPTERRAVWRAAWFKYGGMSYGEIGALGLAIAIGATLGLSGISLCVGIVSFPIMSHIVERLRPVILETRRSLGLEAAPVMGSNSDTVPGHDKL